MYPSTHKSNLVIYSPNPSPIAPPRLTSTDAPVCAPGQMTTYGVARHEDAEVTCRVAANPPALRFKWTFNNTADTIDVPPGRFTSQPTYSIITYTPMTELDYGTLLCWATNDIGPQSYPCIFHIVPAGKRFLPPVVMGMCLCVHVCMSISLSHTHTHARQL